MKILTLIVIVIFFAFKVCGHGTVIIQGVEHEKGEIDVKIYMDKKSFLKEELAIESIRKKPVYSAGWDARKMLYTFEIALGLIDNNGSITN